MVESAQNISTDGHHKATEKKEKNATKARHKRSKSDSKQKSNKKDLNNDRDDIAWNANADKCDKVDSKTELKIQVEIKDNSSTWNSRELYDHVDNAWDEKDESSRDDGVSSKALIKVSSRQRSSKKVKKGSRKCTEIIGVSGKLTQDSGDLNKNIVGPRRATVDDNVEKFNVISNEQKERGRISGRPLKSSTRTRDSSRLKEDTRPSVPRRASDAHGNDDISVDKSPSIRKLRKTTRQKECDEESLVDDSEDKQPTKPGRATHRVSPESNTDDNDENELSVGSFHSLRKDSDKPRSRSNTRRRTPNSSRRNKTPTGGRLNRRRLKDKALNGSEHFPVSNSTESCEDMDGRGTKEINLKEDEKFVSGNTRSRRDRRRDRERLVSNDVIRDGRKMKSNASNVSRTGRSSLSTRRGGIRRSHSERWNRAVESLEPDSVENPHVTRRRAHEPLQNRTSDGLSRSAHSRIRRNNSSGLARMNGSINNRSYHGLESDRRTSLDGRRTPRRTARRHLSTESSNSLGDDSIDSFGDGHSFGDGRSQATLESIDDFEDFGEDFYGMELQTPGMIDFEEEMLDLMQRANPEVTDHLDRRVHRKREMVVYDHNMPMMTRQALLTRQASSQVQRQFFDGSNIDKKRLLLRNDSMTSNNSSHRAMRSTHGRRAPPRAKSSGLGAMGRGGYMDSLGGPTRQSDSDDRRRVFRSRSSQTASFNQYYQNKPNKVRNLSRRASGDLVQPHGMRGQSRSSDHRRRSVQRANSTTAIRRANSTDHVAPRKPERKMSGDESWRRKQPCDNDGGKEVELDNGQRSPSYSLKRSSLHDSLMDGRKNDKVGHKNDMSIKRNRSKLHLLMYMTKMSVDMDVLFQKVREGEKPRPPIDTLRMPSP